MLEWRGHHGSAILSRPHVSPVMAGPLGLSSGKSPRWPSSRTRACPTSKCCASSWRVAFWTSRTTAPTCCTYFWGCRTWVVLRASLSGQRALMVGSGLEEGHATEVTLIPPHLPRSFSSDLQFVLWFLRLTFLGNICPKQSLLISSMQYLGGIKRQHYDTGSCYTKFTARCCAQSSVSRMPLCTAQGKHPGRFGLLAGLSSGGCGTEVPCPCSKRPRPLPALAPPLLPARGLLTSSRPARESLLRSLFFT